MDLRRSSGGPPPGRTRPAAPRAPSISPQASAASPSVSALPHLVSDAADESPEQKWSLAAEGCSTFQADAQDAGGASARLVSSRVIHPVRVRKDLSQTMPGMSGSGRYARSGHLLDRVELRHRVPIRGRTRRSRGGTPLTIGSPPRASAWRQLDRADDLHVPSARQGSGADLRLGGVGGRLQQPGRRHDHARRAEAALGPPSSGSSAGPGAAPAAGAQRACHRPRALDRRHLAAVTSGARTERRRRAGVDQDRARAAVAGIAARFVP